MVESIAIIGGGASGVIALDTLIKDGFTKVKLFERRAVPGGVWVLDRNPKEVNIEPGLNELALDPQLDNPLKEANEVKLPRSSQERFIETASYEDLRTNIPEQLMTFSDLKSWGEGTDYVNGEVIQRYIENYINRNISYVEYNTSVEDIYKNYEVKDSKFELTLRKEVGDEDYWYKESFDAVIVATGHYHVPFIPDVDGLKQVWEKYPNKVKHSKYFRKNHDFKDKTVVVIGTRASGSDIVAIAAKNGVKKLYHSKRAGIVKNEEEQVEIKPEISKYEIVDEDIIVHFKDGSTVINPDEVIYATGFRYSYPFLRRLYPNFTTGYIIPDLYQHTFFIKDPKLSIIGVPTDAISFRIFEFQAVLVSRYYKRKIELPDLKEQLEWSVRRYQEKGNSRAYHTIDNKIEYFDTLVKLGGGISPEEGYEGKLYPTFSKEDIELHDSLLERLRLFYSESNTR